MVSSLWCWASCLEGAHLQILLHLPGKDKVELLVPSQVDMVQVEMVLGLLP